MNNKIMQEYLQTAKQGATTAELKSFVSHLESFMEFEERRNKGQDVKNEWITSRNNLIVAMDEVTKAYGIS